MVGDRRCRGYYRDASGQLVRVVSAEKDESFVGPGCYDPQYASISRRGIRISPNSKRAGVVPGRQSPGPASYHSEHEPRKKIDHVFERQPREAPSRAAFASGNLEHESWLTAPSSPVPRRRFPRVRFRGDGASPQFASREARELFRVAPPTVTTDAYAPSDRVLRHDLRQRQAAEAAEHNKASYSIFKRSPAFLPRFEDADTGTPAPDQYQQIKPLVAGPAHRLSPSFEADPDDSFRPKPVPGPGYYQPKRQRTRKQPTSPVFATKIERLPEQPSDAPPVGTYDVPVAVDVRIPIAIKAGARDERPDTDWTHSGIADAPRSTQYDVRTDKRVKGGLMTASPREIWPKHEDHKLAFATPHSSLIKRTYNSHYYHVNRQVC
jgi:hypothetical protein